MVLLGKIYQEQVMQIAQELSGYSLGEADLLRRAMGKKKVEEMEKQKVPGDGVVAEGPARREERGMREEGEDEIGEHARSRPRVARSQRERAARRGCANACARACVAGATAAAAVGGWGRGRQWW